MKRQRSNAAGKSMLAAGLILACAVVIAAAILLLFGGGRKNAPQAETVSAAKSTSAGTNEPDEKNEAGTDAAETKTETEPDTKPQAESETEPSVTEQGWQQKNGKWYYYDEQGKPKTGWLDWQGKRYYLQEDGSMKTGFWEITSDKIFVYDPYEGRFGKKGEGYYFLEDGSMFTGDIMVFWESANEYSKLEQYAKERGMMSVDLSSEMGRGLTTAEHFVGEAGYTFHEDGTYRYWAYMSE